MPKKPLNDNLVDLNADYYEKKSSLQNNLAREILNDYCVNPKSHILDIGCGDGKITVELSKIAKQGEVLGIDSSPDMIRFALTKFPKTKFPNLQFLQKKAEFLSIFRKFDLIISFSCFHWIRQPELVFQKLNNLLKKEGELLILTYPKESHYYQYLELALESYPDYRTFSAYLTMPSISEYQTLLSRNNLETITFQKRDFVASYSNVNEIQEFIKGWLNSYVPFPEDLHQKFLQDVCQAVLNDPKTQKDNKIVIPYSALIIRARQK